MIKHIVLFKLKDPTCAEKARDLILSMKGTVEQIKELEVGIDLYHTDRSFDLALTVIVENEEDLRGYAEHPYHVNVVKKYLTEASEKSVIVDYRR
jgi:hypothetical protein